MKHTGDYELDRINMLEQECADLEEENKSLKEELGEKIDTIQVLIREKYEEKGEKLELFKENKNLKEKLDKLQDEYDELYIEKCNASNQWKCCEAENKELKEDADFFRQCYLDLKKLCEKEGFMLSDEEVTKMFNLDEIK